MRLRLNVVSLSQELGVESLFRKTDAVGDETCDATGP
jgi:hypothetical protein